MRSKPFPRAACCDAEKCRFYLAKNCVNNRLLVSLYKDTLIMLSPSKNLPLSPYSGLYDELIPKNNLYRRLADEIDYSFIYRALRPLYDSSRGRLGVDPDRMVKILMLKAMTDLSDRDLVEDITFNMAYKYFLGMMPEEKVVESSTLSKFRTKRLKGNSDLLRELLDETISMAVERGIIKRDKDGNVKVRISYDSTHTLVIGAITEPKKGAIYYMDKLYRMLENSQEGITATLPAIPQKFGSSAEAVTMLEDVCEKVRTMGLVTSLGVSRLLHRMEEAVEDYKTIGSYCCADRDARLGYKSVNKPFVGYKNHIGTDVDSGLIVNIETTTGNASDTTVGREMITSDIKREDIGVTQILGDGAYGSTDILELVQGKAELIAPPNAKLGSSDIERDGFTFNKDAGMVVCPNGHLSIKCTTRHYKNENNRRVDMYYFDIDKCRVCPLRDRCLTKSDSRSKSYSVSVNTQLQKEHIRKSQTGDFKEKYRQRTISERTNSVLKKSFGLKETYAKGLEMVTVQSAVAVLAYNLRLIINKTACK